MAGTDGGREERYQLRGKLGEGGAAEVWLALDQVTGSEVALKMLHPHCAANPEMVARFRHEAEVARALRHPGIIQVLDLVEQNRWKRPFLVMDYVAGGSLAAQLGQPLPVAQALTLLRKIATSVAAVHRAGLVHRDLKPSNLLLTRNGGVKLTDFGLAHDPTAPRVTAEGIVWGTAEYISPEQLQNQPLTPTSDIYALGIILFEMLTGRPPFEGNDMDVARAHLLQPPPDVRQFNPQLPGEVALLVQQMLAKEAGARRPTDAPTLLKRLSQVEKVTRTLAARPAAPPTRKQKVVGAPTRKQGGVAAPLPQEPPTLRWPTVSPAAGAWLQKHGAMLWAGSRRQGAALRQWLAQRRAPQGLQRAIHRALAGGVDGLTAGVLSGLLGGAVAGWAVALMGMLATGTLPALTERWLWEPLTDALMADTMRAARESALGAAAGSVVGALLNGLMGTLLGAVRGARGILIQRGLIARTLMAAFGGLGGTLLGALLVPLFLLFALPVAALLSAQSGRSNPLPLLVGDLSSGALLLWLARGMAGGALLAALASAHEQPMFRGDAGKLRGALLGAMSGMALLVGGELLLQTLLAAPRTALVPLLLSVVGSNPLRFLGSAEPLALVGATGGAMLGALASRHRP